MRKDNLGGHKQHRDELDLQPGKLPTVSRKTGVKRVIDPGGCMSLCVLLASEVQGIMVRTILGEDEFCMGKSA